MSDHSKEMYFDKLIDRELLIRSVHDRPVLWDRYLDIYKEKVAKTAAWREICLILKEDFDEMEEEEREHFVKCVIKRWTQIRDAWIKSLNLNKTSKMSELAATSRKPYKYHNQLKFLRNVVKLADNYDKISTTRIKPVHVKLEDNSCEQIEDNQNEQETDVQKLVSDQAEYNQTTNENQETDYIKPVRKRKTSSEADEKTIWLIEHQIKQHKEKENENRNLSFFKSLLPSLTALDDDQTLEFHYGVINLLKTIKKKPSYLDWPHHCNCAHQGRLIKPETGQLSSAASTSARSQYSDSS